MKAGFWIYSAAMIFFIHAAQIYPQDRFFFSEYDLLLKRMEENASTESRFYLDTVRQQQIETSWTYPELPPDFYTHQIPELNYAPMEQAQLRRAYSHYENAVLLIENMKKDLIRMDKKIRSVRSDIWWKVIDETDSLMRQRHRIKMKYSTDLARTAGKSIEILEGIQNTKVRSSRAFINLYYQSLRMHAIYEAVMFNYDSAFYSLQKYKINENSDLEWPYHYLLSICYRYKFRLAQKNTRIYEKELLELRKMKNLHKKLAVSLKYGIESEEYNLIKNKIRLEELGSPRRIED
ncbi:MAG: hypothetical protein OEZ34_11205 [Spirochaetia bacterium]|nr:hypothetical protein [Spirochaetia bacterium]